LRLELHGEVEVAVEDGGCLGDRAERLREICRTWADDSKEPFVTLVARHGVIVLHEAFGRDAGGRPLGLDFRPDVASISQCATALLFSQFLDQGLLRLDERVSTLSPATPTTPRTCRPSASASPT